ncbi:MAG: alpha/beta hydrolase [Clostridiales bacterium]|nr:alpha/beta hydrolase [Clostridiales bacterium]
MSEELAEHIPSARLEIVPGAGHEVNLEMPERLAELLQDFYQK